MSKVPNLPYTQIISALERDGWVVVRQRGSHIRLQKELPEKTNSKNNSSSTLSCQTLNFSSYPETSLYECRSIY
jgi:predicted RNA binding protein YcfA (HicA-like mRNA interferase family)